MSDFDDEPHPCLTDEELAALADLTNDELDALIFAAEPVDTPDDVRPSDVAEEVGNE
jgi:hypothetical protein